MMGRTLIGLLAVGCLGVADPGTLALSGDACEQMCGHLYQDCRYGFYDGKGELMDEAECNEMCGTGSIATPVAWCLGESSCDQEAMDSCYVEAASGGCDPQGPPICDGHERVSCTMQGDYIVVERSWCTSGCLDGECQAATTESGDGAKVTRT